MQFKAGYIADSIARVITDFKSDLEKHNPYDQIKLDQINGLLQHASSFDVSYVHGGYASVHEGNMYLIFENGVLVNEYIKWLTKEEIEKILKEDEDLPF